jgi:hypothetical protein
MRRRVPWFVVCGADCRRAVYAARTRRRNPDYRCQSCGALFSPKRTDALFCSPACRQRDYRGRLKGVDGREAPTLTEAAD